MKDHTFDARNDEMRARAKHARKANATPPVESTTTEAAALADATDLAIGAASPAPRAKKATRKNTLPKPGSKESLKRAANGEWRVVDAAIKAARATQQTPADANATVPDKADAPAPRPTKKKVAKAIDAAIAVDKVAAPTKPAKVDWLDTGLDRTGKLTVDALARAWIAHLEEGGKTTASTIASYANDLKTAIAFFGADKPVAGINAAYVTEFNNSDGVMKLRGGEPKAQPTILKMRRAFRMALEWARGHGVDKG